MCSTLLTDCFGVPADYMPRELDSLACGSSLKLHEANTVVEYTNSHDGINGVRHQCWPWDSHFTLPHSHSTTGHSPPPFDVAVVVMMII